VRGLREKIQTAIHFPAKHGLILEMTLKTALLLKSLFTSGSHWWHVLYREVKR
jgi:hypothetical protein